MYALSHYTRGTLGLVNLFCRTWSISSLNGVKFYAEGGKWECRHQKQTIERLNRSFKGNYRASTGFGSPTGSASYTALYSAAYNFLRPHEALDYQVPVSLPELQDKPRMYDKWLALIDLAPKQLPTAQPA